ncbi:competence protein ComK [Cytobacillus solani]|uniref:competence protein ComK n=1 Tax=Cytobacillus solani TaxID=1637975 RepID=UPI002079FB9A|nr:competence protein ComK [Cytobacillus solani]USK56526.1 competence protein ComK [Cytobacillus solani]
MNGQEISSLIDEYEINPNTMVVMPLAYGSKIYSQIWELEDEFISPFKPIDIIKKSCTFFGSSYEGLNDMEELKKYRLIKIHTFYN